MSVYLNLIDTKPVFECPRTMTVVMMVTSRSFLYQTRLSLAHRMPYFSVLGILKYDSLVGQLTRHLIVCQPASEIAVSKSFELLGNWDLSSLSCRPILCSVFSDLHWNYGNTATRWN